jgi:hypothetical protein
MGALLLLACDNATDSGAPGGTGGESASAGAGGVSGTQAGTTPMSAGESGTSTSGGAAAQGGSAFGGAAGAAAGTSGENGGAAMGGNATGGAAATAGLGGDAAGSSGAAGIAGTSSGGAGGASGGSAGATSGSAGESPGGGAGTGGSATGATIVPDGSWTCGMPDGIPSPEQGELVFQASVELGYIHDVGATQYGQRRLLDLAGGDIEGERLSGSFLAGGIDFELTLSNGTVELEQVTMLRASDDSLIYMRTCGVAPAGDPTVRVVFDFEVANSSALAWLNSGTFVGTRVVDEPSETMTLAVYDVSDIAPADPRIELADPSGVPQQPWDCATASGTRGATVFTESVGIGASLSVGTSKRGNRNVIPITGGSMSGRVTGSVVPGGADYQLLSGTTTLDARYSLSTDDGEYIVVRNCGPFGALVPTFEARADGPYAFLNSNDYVSSEPGGGGGGVSITFYELN